MTEKIRLLIVDEVAKAREIIRYALEDSFSMIEIDEARSGDEAKRKMENRRYDLVLCDWESPRIRGEQLLGWMREHPELHSLPFIMLTAKNEKPLFTKALHSGVNSYLIKPFTVAGLIHRIMSVVATIDRREHERFIADCPVTFKFYGHKQHGHLLDISLGGLLGTFRKREPFPRILEKLLVDIEPDPRSRISEVHGFVVRIQAAEKTLGSKYVNIAVRFMNLGSRTRDELAGFLNTLVIKI